MDFYVITPLSARTRDSWNFVLQHWLCRIPFDHKHTGAHTNLALPLLPSAHIKSMCNNFYSLRDNIVMITSTCFMRFWLKRNEFGAHKLTRCLYEINDLYASGTWAIQFKATAHRNVIIWRTHIRICSGGTLYILVTIYIWSFYRWQKEIEKERTNGEKCLAIALTLIRCDLQTEYKQY